MAAARSQVKCLARLRARRAKSVRVAGLAANRSMAAARAAVSDGGKRSAVPAAMSLMGRMSDAMSGTPAAMASTTGMPKPSKVDGKTANWARAYNSIMAGRGSQPVIVISFSRA